MKKIFAITLACALFVFGMSFAQAEATAAATVTLVENPTTGYTWTVVSGDEAILTVKDDGFTAAPAAEATEGAGGTHSWTATGVKEGDATITFTLGQAWDGGEVSDTLVYTYHVAADASVSLTATKGIPERYMPDKAVVWLVENPTTGYQWAYQASAEGILTLVKDEFLMPEQAAEGEALVGAPGTHYWVFQGAAEGDVTLTFSYARSFEEGVKPEATITYTYHVDSAMQITNTQMDGDFDAYNPMAPAAQ